MFFRTTTSLLLEARERAFDGQVVLETNDAEGWYAGAVSLNGAVSVAETGGASGPSARPPARLFVSW